MGVEAIIALLLFIAVVILLICLFKKENKLLSHYRVKKFLIIDREYAEKKATAEEQFKVEQDNLKLKTAEADKQYNDLIERKRYLESNFEKQKNAFNFNLEKYRQQKKFEIEQQLQQSREDALIEAHSYLEHYRTEQMEQINKDLLNAKDEVAAARRQLDAYRENRLKEINKEIEQATLSYNEFIEGQNSQKASMLEDINIIKAELDDFYQRRESINREIAHQREIEEKQDYYRIVLNEDDIEDIEMLKQLAPKLRRRELIPKLIWDALIQRPANEMLKRVLGDKNPSGIYKITFIPTGEAYIGKSVGVRDRWRSHIQTALGLEKIASSTFHNHMASHGVQNYVFELLEEVPKEKLSEREKFYINFYGTTTQLNTKAGG